MPLPIDSVKISDSSNGKARVITITGINIRLDIKEIRLSTVRRFFEKDTGDVDGLGVELTGKVDFPLYERQLIASNDGSHLCNPTNGVSCYPVFQTDEEGNTNIIGYKDALGNDVSSPIGLFDFFKPFLSQPTAIMSLMLQNVQAEDQIYQTWNK